MAISAIDFRRGRRLRCGLHRAACLLGGSSGVGMIGGVGHIGCMGLIVRRRRDLMGTWLVIDWGGAQALWHFSGNGWGRLEALSLRAGCSLGSDVNRVLRQLRID